MFWNIFKKPHVEAIAVSAAFEVDGKSFFISQDGALVGVSSPTDIMSWQSATTLRATPPSTQFRFKTVNDNPVRFASGEYPIVKLRNENEVWVLANVDVQFDNDNSWTLTTRRNAYVLYPPMFDGGFDYEEAERKRITQEEKEARKREAIGHLAELILNLLDDHADKNEDFHIKNPWSGLTAVEMRGAFDFYEIANILMTGETVKNKHEFTEMLVESFKKSQNEGRVVLVDDEFWMSVKVYGGTYDLELVATDVIDYLKTDEFEGGVNE